MADGPAYRTGAVCIEEKMDAEELAELEEYQKQASRIAQIRTTKDGANWTRAGGGWRKVSLIEARDGD